MSSSEHILNWRSTHLSRYIITICSLVISLTLTACGQSDSPTPSGGDQTQTNPTVESYIVVLKPKLVTALTKQMRLAAGAVHLDSRQLLKSSVSQLLAEVKNTYGLQSMRREFSVALQGGVVSLTPEQATALAEDSRVAYVEKDQRVQVTPINIVDTPDEFTPVHNSFTSSVTQTDATWGLDRIDQLQLPLNQNYNYVTRAANVNAYIIDTGVLLTHQDFQGRAHSGFDFVDRDSNATDCNGHGTHVAGTIGSATYGVAKAAQLIAVRVLDCNGSGSYSDVIAGVEWVTANHVKPAVANMSVGGPISQALDDAISASIRAGVTYVVAAGNESSPACNGSPARAEPAITVGATTNGDARSSFSNYGTCVDLFAPGSDIKSTWSTSSSSTNTISGTSMASPHVAGVAALFLALHPTATPAQVRAALVGGSTSGRLASVGSGSPNLFLNTLFLNAGDGGGTTPVPPPSPEPPVPPLPPSDPAAPCAGCDIYAGKLNRRGDFRYHPDSGSYVSHGGLQKFRLKGPVAGADFDIYLYKISGSSVIRVASSVKTKSDESINYLGTAGTYKIKVVSYSGKGSYKLIKVRTHFR